MRQLNVISYCIAFSSCLTRNVHTITTMKLLSHNVYNSSTSNFTVLVLVLSVNLVLYPNSSPRVALSRSRSRVLTVLYARDMLSYWTLLFQIMASVALRMFPSSTRDNRHFLSLSPSA